MLKNLKRAAAIVLSFAMAIQFGLANSYYVNAEEEPVEPQQEQTTTVENNSEVQEEDANGVAVPETKSVELSYVAEDGTVLQAATYRDFDLNYGLNTDSSVMLNFDGYTLKDVIVNNSQAVSADQASLSVTSDLASVQFVYKKVITETENQTTEPAKTEEKNEDDAEADPNPETEVKEELPEYPAFDQSEMAGNVVVRATAAEGVLPRDSKLVVKRITRKAILNAVEETVSEKNMEVESAVALDVTIQSKDGVEIQPKGFVNISFENAAVSGDEINVYHVTDDASAVTEVATNTQSFDANHFSIYVITGEKNVPLTTFNFVDAKGQIVSTQIVKTGDELITPTAPDAIGQAFVGWVDEAGNPFTGFGKQAEITETTKRTITARYEAALYVYFLNPDGTQIMRTEKVGDHEAHDFTAISYDVDSTHKLVGWAAEKNGTTNIADKITVPKGSTSVNVYAIIKEGYWISFDSDGGSIVDSQFVLNGGQLDLNENTNPTKPGYTFDGWYNGPTKVEKGTTVTSPMTLKAHWSATQVSYTVIHWWENADDNEYSFHESETKTGLTGSEVNAKAKSYEGFTAQPVTKKTIKGDGSTIVSVYYKRNVYEVTFYSFSEGFGLWYKPSKEYTDLKITAKYGQDISKQWPTMNGSSTWRTKDGSGAYQVNIGTMPLGGAKFYGPKTGKKYETASYYVEVLPGETSDVTVGGIQYKLDHKDTSPGTGYFVTKEDQYPLKGFTFNEKSSTKIEEDYNNAKFYYTRNSYKIKFINNGKEDKSVEKKYEQSISNENYTPDKPNSLATYYEFDGWYDNELCEGEKYVFDGKTMPAQNVTLYAKWTAKKISLTYNLNNPKGTVDKDTKKVAAGTIASTVLPSASSIEGYSFAGWYVADENGHMTTVAFNANDAITKDTSVIGKWLYNGKLTVKYVADGVEAPKDNNVYAGGAKATVASGVTKEGKKFLGWQLDKLDRNVYQPGQSFEVNKDLADDKNVITLKAVFGDSETSAILTYHRGNGNGEDHSDAILNNVEVTLKNTSDPSLSYTAPGEDYYFAGWATSVEDAQKGNAAYAAGERVRVNADSSNDLYATWVKKTVIEVTANSNTLPYNGEERKVEGFSVTSGYEVTGLTAVAKGINCGTYETKITGTAIVTKDGVDVTDKVIVNKKNGTLTITPKSVTVTGNNGNKVYGEADPELTATVAGTLGKDKVKYTVARESGEDVGHYSVIPTGEEIQGNYKVTYVAGTLTITAQSIDPGTDPDKPNPDYTGAKVNNPSDEVYDGKEHKWIPTVTDKADKKLKVGTDYTVEYSTKNFKDVGTIDVTITGIKNYTGKATRTYSITPKTYTVTTESASKVYDGTALTAGGKVSGIVKGETVDFTITGSQTSVDTSDNTYELNWTGSAKESNYKHGKDSIGTLTVKAKSIIPDGPDTPEEEKTGITVSDPSDSKYDDKEHREVLTVKDTKTNEELVAEKDYSVTYSDDLVNAGTVTITIEGIGNYTGSFTKTYEITKRSVTLTSATASKTYDGQALTSTSITVSGDGFVKGEGATYNVTGTQTEVGNSANSFEYKLNENTLASNYDITKVVGTLTITAAPAPVIPAPTPRTPSTTPRTPSAPQVTTPVETVEKETTPKAEPKEEKVEEEYTPKASPQYYWALINLICAILTVLFGLLLLISKRHKSEDDDEEDDETKQQTNNDDEEKEQEKKRGLFTRVLAVLIAIASVVFFLVTEDMSLAWTWTDQWTI